MNEIDKWEISEIEKLYKSIIMKESLLSISIFSFINDVIYVRRVRHYLFPEENITGLNSECDETDLKMAITNPRKPDRAPEKIAKDDQCSKWNNCFGKYVFKLENNLMAYYVGDYKDGEPSGRGTLIFSDGYVYQGEFKSGLKNGFGAAFVKDKKKYKKYIGIWKDDKLIKKQ